MPARLSTTLANTNSKDRFKVTLATFIIKNEMVTLHELIDHGMTIPRMQISLSPTRVIGLMRGQKGVEYDRRIKAFVRVKS